MLCILCECAWKVLLEACQCKCVWQEDTQTSDGVVAGFKCGHGCGTEQGKFCGVFTRIFSGAVGGVFGVISRKHLSWLGAHDDSADGDGKVILIHIDYYTESYMMLHLPSWAQTVNCYAVSIGTGHTCPILFQGLNLIRCHSDWVKKVNFELVGSGHYTLNTWCHQGRKSWIQTWKCTLIFYMCFNVVFHNMFSKLI